jgi:outer membrane protein TolC
MRCSVNRGFRALAMAAMCAAAATAAAAQSGPAGISPQSPLLGGVPTGAATSETLRLSLHEAIQRGLQHNLAAVLGEQRVRAADGSRWMAMSGLLPTVSMAIGQSRSKVNLQEYGFPLPPGESPLIGPFNVASARVSVSQPLFDFSAIQDARAGAAMKTAADLSLRDTREQVVVTIATGYFQVVATASRVEAARAQLATALALHARAVSMKEAGTVAGIEVLRAQVQAEGQRQRVIYYENELAKQKLAMARAIGLPLAQPFELSDDVPYKVVDTVPLETALDQAYARRPDYKAAQVTLKSAEASRRAAYGVLLPSLQFAASFGDVGPAFGSWLGTYSVLASVRIPLFQAGRERGRILQADATVRQDRAQLDDMKARIEYEVRAAFLDVRSTEERVRVARGAAELAGRQLAQAQDRFTAGVASHIEVVQAQEYVATESENLIASLFAHNVATAALARALGVAEEAAERLLGGQ